MKSNDRIEKVITVPVPRERVWLALTTPDQLSIWFADKVDIDLRPGGAALFDWGEENYTPAVVEAVEPPHRLAFRWRSHKSEQSQTVETLPGTLVEFILDEVEEGTRLTLVESGFSALPEEIRAPSLSDNNARWDEELEDLITYFSAQPMPAM